MAGVAAVDSRGSVILAAMRLWNLAAGGGGPGRLPSSNQVCYVRALFCPLPIPRRGLGEVSKSNKSVLQKGQIKPAWRRVRSLHPGVYPSYPGHTLG